MRRRKCQPEHRAPRPTNDGRRRVHHLCKIGDVLRDRQRYLAAAALKRLEHSEPVSEGARQRGDRSRCCGSTVQDNEYGSGSAVVPDGDRLHRRTVGACRDRRC